MNKTTWKSGDRVYVPGLSGHYRLVSCEGNGTWIVQSETGYVPLTRVHVTAMEAPKDPLYRDPGDSVSGDW